MKVKTCRLCLAVEVKVFKLGNTETKQLIETVFTQNGCINESLDESHYICYMCKALLDKLNNFIQRVVRAQKILAIKLAEKKKLSLQTLKEIDTEQNDISYNLVVQVSKNINIYATNEPQEDNEMIEVKVEKKELSDDDMILIENSSEHSSNVINVVENYDELKPVTFQEVVTKYENNDEENDPTFSMKYYKSEDSPEHSSNFLNVIESNDELKPVTIQRVVTKYEKNDEENDPTFSMKYYKGLRKKVKKTKRNSQDTGKVPKPTKKTKLLPSNFILSLQSVGNKRERWKNKQYKFKDEHHDDWEIKELDNEKGDKIYEVSLQESTQASSDFNFDMYDKNSKKTKKPQPEYPRKCDHCESEIEARAVHYRHYLLEHPQLPYPYLRKKEVFVCQFCGKLSNRKELHVAHELTHNEEKIFKCPECHKKFHNKIRMGRHVTRTHTKKLLECHFCSKQFKTREDITRHIRIHTGDKPFKCHICGARFAHKGNVGVHIRVNHGASDVTIKNTNSKSKHKRERKH